MSITVLQECLTPEGREGITPTWSQAKSSLKSNKTFHTSFKVILFLTNMLLYSELSIPDMVYFQGEFEANMRHVACQDFGSLI